MAWRGGVDVGVPNFSWPIGKSKAFQICESLSIASILGKKIFRVATRMRENTASEDVVLHLPLPH